jgi:anthranilate synthase component 1
MTRFHPSREEFREASLQGNLIPIYREVVSDLETPVSAFKKLGTEPNSFLLESVEGGEKLGRFSFIGLGAMATFRSHGHEVEIIHSSGRRESFQTAQPLDALKSLLLDFKVVESESDPPGFFGGAVGYISWEEIRNIEPSVGAQKKPEMAIPHVQFSFPDTLLIFDHVRHRLRIVAFASLPPQADPNEAYDDAVRRIQLTHQRLAKPLFQPEQTLAVGETTMVSNMTKEEFFSMVSSVKEYILSGDAFQVVVSQRFEIPVSSDPFDIYRSLRVINPSPYMFFFRLEGFCLAGSSPETLIKGDRDHALIRPIAGTRPRGKNDKEDLAYEKDLLADPKECAEHIMLVDLARNDLGRVSIPGSVKVDELMVIERYSHVMHIVSQVSGDLQPEVDGFAVFKSAFPHGTVSGAPKIRAIQIIDELEPTARGPYAGAVGYFGFNGAYDLCITLRTISICDGKAYVQAGAGIVADSDPEAEFQETVNKASAMIRAIELTERGGE